MKYRIGALLIALVGVSPTASAQMSANPPAVAEGVRAFGDRLGPDVVKGVTDLYKPLHAAASKDGVRVSKDIAYGDGERQKLDLYTPANLRDGSKAPILVFAHGGGFAVHSEAEQALGRRTLCTRR